MSRFDLVERHPWVAVGAALLAVCFIGGAAVRQEIRQPPSSAEHFLALGLGVLCVLALVMGWKKLNDAESLWGLLVLIVTTVALVVIGFGGGLGWWRYHPDIDPATLPRGLQAFGAGVILALVAVLLLGCAIAAFRLISGTYPRSNQQ